MQLNFDLDRRNYPMAQLRFTKGPREGEIVLLDKPKTSFGRRRSSDCALDHKEVSRDQFHIEAIRDKYFLVDDESGNGTSVNGRSVTWIELNDGDVIRVGPFELVAQLSRLNGKGDDSYPAPERPGIEPGYLPEHERIYPAQFLAGIAFFNQRNYYDAHEAWEEIWLRTSGEEKLFYQMLIQSAVGLHHYERGNARGAGGMYNAAMKKLKELPGEFMSVDLGSFARELSESLRAVAEGLSDSVTPNRGPRPSIALLPLGRRS